MSIHIYKYMYVFLYMYIEDAYGDTPPLPFFRTALCQGSKQPKHNWFRKVINKFQIVKNGSNTVKTGAGKAKRNVGAKKVTVCCINIRNCYKIVSKWELGKLNEGQWPPKWSQDGLKLGGGEAKWRTVTTREAPGRFQEVPPSGVDLAYINLSVR